MINAITGFIGLAMTVVFLGYMVVWVQAIPLIIIVVGVMLLAAIDYVQSVRSGANTLTNRK
jgi:hypothetical protein